ncbi:hypothetical protein [Pseudomonas sp. RIT-PI-AD]|uniref:hypothetical protein n=1 Tax=Pseudomonas sp. RIT-PI-AD TaxID=3035294 RepID=UPI0021D964E8|nr:hypothetical protein [Pseudomonas sp. RIT-PI-AD]
MSIELPSLATRMPVAAMRPGQASNGAAVEADPAMAPAADGSTESPPARVGIRVSLSALGHARSSEANENDNIEKSDLSDTIKSILKMIRQLKTQMTEKQIELQAIGSDGRLDDNARIEQAAQKRSELSSLSGSLSTANSSLLEAMREEGLSAEQMQTATALAMK